MFPGIHPALEFSPASRPWPPVHRLQHLCARRVEGDLASIAPTLASLASLDWGAFIDEDSSSQGEQRKLHPGMGFAGCSDVQSPYEHCASATPKPQDAVRNPCAALDEATLERCLPISDSASLDALADAGPPLAPGGCEQLQQPMDSSEALEEALPSPSASSGEPALLCPSAPSCASAAGAPSQPPSSALVPVQQLGHVQAPAPLQEVVPLLQPLRTGLQKMRAWRLQQKLLRAGGDPQQLPLPLPLLQALAERRPKQPSLAGAEQRSAGAGSPAPDPPTPLAGAVASVDLAPLSSRGPPAQLSPFVLELLRRREELIRLESCASSPTPAPIAGPAAPTPAHIERRCSHKRGPEGPGLEECESRCVGGWRGEGGCRGPPPTRSCRAHGALAVHLQCWVTPATWRSGSLYPCRTARFELARRVAAFHPLLAGSGCGGCTRFSPDG